LCDRRRRLASCEIKKPRLSGDLQESKIAEVSIGIGVALVLTAVWPEREAAALVENVNDSPRKTDGDQG